MLANRLGVVTTGNQISSPRSMSPWSTPWSNTPSASPLRIRLFSWCISAALQPALLRPLTGSRGLMAGCLLCPG